MINKFKINSYNDLLSALKKLNPNVEFMTDLFDEWMGSSVTLDKLVLPKGFYWIGGQEMNDCRSITNRGNNKAGMNSLCITISTVSKMQNKTQAKDDKDEAMENRKHVHCMIKSGCNHEIKQREKKTTLYSEKIKLSRGLRGTYTYKEMLHDLGTEK
ncbi:MAG: hypothetical protein J6B20_02225 [Clostridia bacterium]|nr:hypothetical protein [Clostridia bacterium]